MATRHESSDVLSHVHLPALDGLRGVAILLVLTAHFTGGAGGSPLGRLIQKATSFGWVGVDLFFVLSGFLITGILLDAKRQRASGYFRNFYVRRVLRIFPLYFAFLSLFLIVLPLAVPNFRAVFGRPAAPGWTYWFYVYNLAFGRSDPATHLPVLSVTWTLCIEEQFYLLWPAIIFFCRSRTILRICLTIAVVALLARFVLVLNGFTVYETAQWTFCRMEALATGAALAIFWRAGLLRRLILPARWVVVVVPLATVVLSSCVGSLGESRIYRIGGYSTLAALFGALLVLTLTTSSRSMLSRSLSHPLTRTFGRFSYAIYLFNLPVKIMLLHTIFRPGRWAAESNAVQSLLLFVTATLLTLLLSTASWHLFEKHFLKLKRLFPMDAPLPERLLSRRDAMAVSLARTPMSALNSR